MIRIKKLAGNKKFCYLFIMLFTLIKSQNKLQEDLKVSIKPLDNSYYVGGKALVELTISDSFEIIKKDSRLNEIDEIIINKFNNGKFQKQFLKRYELKLNKAEKLNLDLFLLKKDTEIIELKIDEITVLEEPEILNNYGARLITNLISPYVGQKFKLTYQAMLEHDNKLINYELENFPQDIEIINKNELKSGKNYEWSFEIIAKKPGLYVFPKMIITTARNGSVAHFIGFGKSYCSNQLEIEINKVPSGTIIVGHDANLEITLKDNLTNTELLICKSSGQFINWPKIIITKGEANIYESESKMIADGSSCSFVIQPLSDGELTLKITGNIFDPILKINKLYESGKTVLINNLAKTIKPEIESKSVSPISKTLNFKKWLFLLIFLIIISLFKLFLINFFKTKLINFKKKIKEKYYIYDLRKNLEKNKIDENIIKNKVKLILELNFIKNKILINLLQELIYTDKQINPKNISKYL